jgi:alkylhydroperoxidase/carboxymuconolactone decarboxylase family protein YurZ
MIDDVEQRDPAFHAAALRLSRVPWENGPLEPKVKELISIAIYAAATHLFEPGIRAHIAAAREHGASDAEIMEVFELTSVLGIHTLTVAVPILLEELAAAGAGDEFAEREFTPREAELKERFIAVRGYWSDLWNGVLRLDADFFEAYLEFSSVPWKNGPLEPKVKELVYIAIDVSTTHLFEPGTRIHIRNALGYGATAAEIMEVFELTSLLGLDTLTAGVPALAGGGS